MRSIRKGAGPPAPFSCLFARGMNRGHLSRTGEGLLRASSSPETSGRSGMPSPSRLQHRLRDVAAAAAGEIVWLEQAHPHGVAVAAVDEEFVPQHALWPEAAALVDAHRAGIVLIHVQVELVDVEHAEGVVDGDA